MRTIHLLFTPTHCRLLNWPWIVWIAILGSIPQPLAQPYGKPDQDQPGDKMIQQYLQQESEKLEKDFLGSVKTANDWQAARPQYRQEYYHMLGLWPIPEKTPLRATITRTLEREGYEVDMLHYQSRPGLYVTANLYRPARVEPGQRLPAIFYVCGHSGRGRDGNKTAYQSHGIWFARHGYLCLVVDTLQLGEIAGIHHGTYREGRWWWLSRGYTPAGVECWNGIRGIDYLLSRPDVDPERIGVTGISGGGAATFWIAAADERVKVAVPVSGMADLMSYVPNRVINGHCDCMFLYNTFQWPWTRIAALIAPRPLLFVNSDQDAIFPMDANERVINRLERLYSLFGAGDGVDSVVSIGGHAYRQDIRQAAYRFINTHLQNNPQPIHDSEIDLVADSSGAKHPIPPETLRVFPQDSDIPSDALNARIDQVFVPMAQVEKPEKGAFESWKAALQKDLRRTTFAHFPDRIAPAIQVEEKNDGLVRLRTESEMIIPVRMTKAPTAKPERLILLVAQADGSAPLPAWIKNEVQERDAIYILEPRGLGSTRWTSKNPPNYAERAHYLLGRTVDSGRIWDIVATARYLRSRHGGQVPVYVAGESLGAGLAVYSALLEPDIAGLWLHQLPTTHMDPSAPVLLNVLRTCDLPEAVGLLAPQRIIFSGIPTEFTQKVQSLYKSAGAADQMTVR